MKKGAFLRGGARKVIVVDGKGQVKSRSQKKAGEEPALVSSSAFLDSSG